MTTSEAEKQAMDSQRARAAALLAGWGYALVTVLGQLEKAPDLSRPQDIAIILLILVGLGLSYSMLGIAKGRGVRTVEILSIIGLVSVLLGYSSGAMGLFT